MQHHLMLIIGEKPGKPPRAIYVGRDAIAYQDALAKASADPDFETITPFPFPTPGMVIFPAANAAAHVENLKNVNAADAAHLERAALAAQEDADLASAKARVAHAETALGLELSRPLKVKEDIDAAREELKAAQAVLIDLQDHRIHRASVERAAKTLADEEAKAKIAAQNAEAAQSTADRARQALETLSRTAPGPSGAAPTPDTNPS